MSSTPTMRAVLRNPVSQVHLLGGNKLASSRTPDDTPIVYVVDSDRSEKEGLELLIRSEGWHPQVLGTVHELLNRPCKLVPSCLILNFSQDCGMLEIGKRVTAERPEIPVILITSFGDVRMAVEAIKSGAIDFFLKPFSKDALRRAMSESLECSRKTLDREMEMRGLRTCYASLSHRERQVMRLVVAGLLNKQVGGELGISEITVKAHRRRVMQKMQANSLPELVRMDGELRAAA